MTLKGSLSYSSREVRQTLNTAANSDSPGVALKNKIIKYKYFVFFQDLSQSHTKVLPSLLSFPFLIDSVGLKYNQAYVPYILGIGNNLI